MLIEFVLNGSKTVVEAKPVERLLDVLRLRLGLTGTKEGCGEGECGACSVLINGKLYNSCLTPLGFIQGKEVLTIEGFRSSSRFKIIEQAYLDAGAVQCGFCTPGMIVATEALLREIELPNEEQIREAISGNLCRCTGYNMIIEAIKEASILLAQDKIGEHHG